MKIYVLFFDADMRTHTDRREYRRFVVGIKRLGYSMIQRSVYYRVNEGKVSGRSEYARIAAITPGTIEIRIIEITERIFRNMLYWNTCWRWGNRYNRKRLWKSKRSKRKHQKSRSRKQNKYLWRWCSRNIANTRE